MINMLGSIPRTIEYSIIPGYRNFSEGYKVELEMSKFLNYLFKHCPANINLVPLQSSLEVQVSKNIYSYEFAFDTSTGCSMTEYVFYRPEDPKKANYRG